MYWVEVPERRQTLLDATVAQPLRDSAAWLSFTRWLAGT
jgi:hypothetical protein